ncbi:MAG TPA: hypothetical protein DEA08_13010, partial [Planctomycetes bacterium]|nr:hypothetical protein [Planctomycetota bacterium]
RCDIYALGLCLWRMLTGVIPFDEQKICSSLQILTKHINEDLVDVRERNPQISAGAAALIRGMSQRDPDSRYRSAKHLLADIERVLEGADPLGPRGSLVATTVDLSGGELREASERRRAQSSSRRSSASADAAPSGLPMPLVAGVLVAALGIGVGVALATRGGP